VDLFYFSIQPEIKMKVFYKICLKTKLIVSWLFASLGVWQYSLTRSYEVKFDSNCDVLKTIQLINVAIFKEFVIESPARPGDNVLLANIANTQAKSNNVLPIISSLIESHLLKKYKCYFHQLKINIILKL
jgi:hypothetical protein